MNTHPEYADQLFELLDVYRDEYDRARRAFVATQPELAAETKANDSVVILVPTVTQENVTVQ